MKEKESRQFAAWRSNSSAFVKSENLTLVIALIIMVAIFSFSNKNYFTTRNLINILTSASLTGLVCIGESMLLIGGMMDLSAGATAAFSGVAAGLLLQAGVPMPATFLLVLLCGAFIGCCNSFFITRLHINAFIVTLAMQSVVRGFGYIISDGKGIMIANPQFLKMGTAKLFNSSFLTFPIIVLVFMFIVFFVALKRTRFGREIYIVGGNSNAARLAGISPEKTTWLLFIITGLLAALGGMVLAARMNAAQPQACDNLEFDAITAAILGGIAMSGGYGSLSGAFIGLFILQGFNNGLIMMNVQSFWQNVAKGVLLLLALSFDYFRSRKRRG